VPLAVFGHRAVAHELALFLVHKRNESDLRLVRSVMCFTFWNMGFSL